jgi:hypothetical protein
LLAALNRQRFLSLDIGIAAYAVLYAVYVDGAIRPVISKGAFRLCADAGGEHDSLAVCDHRLCQPLPDAAAGLPNRRS